MALKHLTRTQLEMALNARRAVEQWLGVREQDRRRVIRWLRIEPLHSGGYGVWLHEVFDTGNDKFFDVSEFESVNLDEPEGSSSKFSDWPEALAYAETLGADRDRFLPSGRVQDVYRDFRLRGRN